MRRHWNKCAKSKRFMICILERNTVLYFMSLKMRQFHSNLQVSTVDPPPATVLGVNFFKISAICILCKCTKVWTRQKRVGCHPHWYRLWWMSNFSSSSTTKRKIRQTVSRPNKLAYVEDLLLRSSHHFSVQVIRKVLFLHAINCRLKNCDTTSS